MLTWGLSLSIRHKMIFDDTLLMAGCSTLYLELHLLTWDPSLSVRHKMIFDDQLLMAGCSTLCLVEDVLTWGLSLSVWHKIFDVQWMSSMAENACERSSHHADSLTWSRE